MKRGDRRSGMGIREDHVRIEGVHGLRIGNVEWREPTCAVPSQLSKVHIERPVLLKQEEDVLDDTGSRGADGSGRRCGYRVAICSRRSGVIGRGSARVSGNKAFGWRCAWSAHTIVD